MYPENLALYTFGLTSVRNLLLPQGFDHYEAITFTNGKLESREFMIVYTVAR